MLKMNRLMKYLIFGKTQEVAKMLINNYEIEIFRKKVKNVNLRVYPDLTIKASIPMDIDIEVVEKIITAKSNWIREQLKKYKEQERITKRKYISGENHYLNGKRYILKVFDSNTPCVKVSNIKTINMYVRKNSSIDNKNKLMYQFYKEELQKKLDKYVPKWESKIGIKVNDYSIRKMKARWGTCNIQNKTIIFNLELAKKKDSEIQYVIVHEMLHFIEQADNDNFKRLLNKYYPQWSKNKNNMNELL